MRFYHENCGGEAVVNANEFISVSGFPSFRNGMFSLEAVDVSYRNIGGKDISVSFVCEDCDETVKSAELLTTCLNCYEAFHVDELSVAKDISGVYCDSCKELQEKVLGNKLSWDTLTKVIKKMRVVRN